MFLYSVSPVIVVPPRTVTVEAGSDSRFTCVSVGQPTPANFFTHTNIISVTRNVTADDGRILVSEKKSCDCHMTFICTASIVICMDILTKESCGSHLVDCVM